MKSLKYISVCAILSLIGAVGLELDTSVESFRLNSNTNPETISPNHKSYKAQANIKPTATPQPTLSPEQEQINVMGVEDKIGQLFILSFPSGSMTEFDNNIQYMIDRYKPGGIILFSENIKSEEQVKQLTEKLQASSRIPLFISVDEEGGRVSRIGKLFEDANPSAAEIGALGSMEVAYENGVRIAKQLKHLGFNMDFAPVADINTNPQNTVIGDRAFGNNPELVADMVEASVKGMRSEEILTAIKHFPGHGDTTQDTHKDMATVNHNMERLHSIELVPFRRGIKAGADAVLVAHVSVPAITGNNEPAIFSKLLITDILRKKMNFQGLIITDAMNMGAITKYYSSAEAAIKVIEAGADIILMPEDIENAYHSILELYKTDATIKQRIDESLTRILKLKSTVFE